ncbi:hypothetical protein MAHJHV59_46940 [Mycobacterium avium subsp. hominissuis]
MAKVSTSGRTAGSAGGVAATACQAPARSAMSGCWACSASRDAHRANEVPAAGNATGCPP